MSILLPRVGLALNIVLSTEDQQCLLSEWRVWKVVPWGACVVAQPPAWISPFLTSHTSFFSLTPPSLSADPARVLNMPPIIYVPVGIHGYIRCPVDAEPPATVVKWNKDGRPLQVEKVLERCLWGPSNPTLLTLRCWLWGSGSLPGPLQFPPKTLGKQRAASHEGLWSGRARRQPRPEGRQCSAWVCAQVSWRRWPSPGLAWWVWDWVSGC